MFCIDVHHHFFPANLQKLKADTNQKLGWKTPQGNLAWSPELSLQAMDSLHIDVSILSFPAIAQGEKSEKNRMLARERNCFIADICQRYPSRFGFFATLPFLDDVEGSLSEIAFAFDYLGADGVALSSSYGEGQEGKYIGHDSYDPVWRELDRRGAVVFLHGTQTPSSTLFPDAWLGIPITEVPNETFKAAAHLVVTGRKRKYPNVKIILSHMGGTLPMLAPRVAVLSNYMGCPLTREELLEDFKTFYFETALSSYAHNLVAIDAFAKCGHLLYGSDFPAVNTDMAGWFTRHLEEHYTSEPSKLRQILSENALKLFPNKARYMQQN